MRYETFRIYYSRNVRISPVYWYSASQNYVSYFFSYISYIVSDMLRTCNKVILFVCFYVTIIRVVTIFLLFTIPWNATVTFS